MRILNRFSVSHSQKRENILSEIKKIGGEKSEKSQISVMQYFDYQIILKFTLILSEEDLASSMISIRQNHNLVVF